MGTGTKILSYTAGLACLFFAVLPTASGIRNVGTFALYVLSVFFFFMPRFYPRIGSFHKKHRLISILLWGGVCIGILFFTGASVMIAKTAYFSEPPLKGEVTVIVLGCKVNGETPSLLLQKRITAASEYLHKNDAAICIASGGQGPDEAIHESEAIYRGIRALGIPGSRVVQEKQSTNTEENLAFSLEIIKTQNLPKQIIVVTDGFHQLRASMILKKLDENIEASHISSRTEWMFLPCYWIREVGGILFFSLKKLDKR